MNLKLLQEKRLYPFLEHADKEIAEEVQQKNCPHCGRNLHSANYPRKPRGEPKDVKWDVRWSFCCGTEGCRKRRTPPSVRFLGRKVYVGVVVVLVSAMMHGVNGKRAGKLEAELGIDKRALNRWRKWWLESFVSTIFWRAAKAHLMPPLDEAILPLCLVERFGATTIKKLAELMKFIKPITTTWGEEELTF